MQLAFVKLRFIFLTWRLDLHPLAHTHAMKVELQLQRDGSRSPQIKLHNETKCERHGDATIVTCPSVVPSGNNQASGKKSFRRTPFKTENLPRAVCLVRGMVRGCENVLRYLEPIWLPN